MICYISGCDSRYHSLTQYRSICVSRDFLGHFNEHLWRLPSKDLRLAFRQNPRFADVKKHAQLELCPALWTIKDRLTNSEAVGSWNRCPDARWISVSHPRPIKWEVLTAAGADLMVAAGMSMRPQEFVRAGATDKASKQIGGHGHPAHYANAPFTEH